jgi:hypothetical protein
MYCNIQALPNRTPSEYRVMFYSDPGTRPQEIRVVGDAVDLQQFLETRLELDSATARVHALAAETTRAGAHFDRLPLNEQEVHAMIRAVGAERKAAEAEARKKGTDLSKRGVSVEATAAE